MVDSVKNYGIAGVAANVELGKQGAHIVGSASSVTLESNVGVKVTANIADGVNTEHAVTLSQLESIEDNKVTVTTVVVNYNDAETVSIGRLNANATVLSVTVTPTTNWTSANSSTNITVGDSGDTDRLFASFDPAIQVTDETNHKYLSQTDIFATVTQGGASAGTAKIAVLHSGTIS